MGYRQRPDYLAPSVEDLEQQRKSMLWLIPMVIIQQGTSMFGADTDIAGQVMSTLAWASVTLLILLSILGVPLPWMSERDKAIIGDEWHQLLAGDCARWAFAALTVSGIALLLLRFGLPLDMGKAVFGVVNAAMITAVLRQAWLNHMAGSDEDE
ncbi:hypothetical protein [Sphingomonas sp. LHG3443-2]|uniref:hypothetical protein n=1 Tax=Sphingomonas sp. LHG3443-2 TaxID=2804639 RepID=UPI003CF3E4E6